VEYRSAHQDDSQGSGKSRKDQHYHERHRMDRAARIVAGKGKDMTDREELKLAAKAAGYELQETEDGFEIDFDDSRIWNPLADDGDALRLAVRLRMTVKVTDYGAAAYKGDLFRLVALDEATTVETATRRAIVRAAAEIGRNMT
jgi:hypothetical protein